MEVNTNDTTLQILLIQKEISENILKTKHIEMQQKMLDNKLLLSTKEAAVKLNTSVEKIINMYKGGAIKGIEDGKSIKIIYDSLLEYIAKTQDPNFTADAYYSNVQNVLKRARNVTRSEVDKYNSSK